MKEKRTNKIQLLEHKEPHRRKPSGNPLQQILITNQQEEKQILNDCK